MEVSGGTSIFTLQHVADVLKSATKWIEDHKKK